MDFVSRFEAGGVIDSTFGEYRLLRELGRGGMGVVYAAESVRDGRTIALKMLSHALDDEESQQRFLREGRVASRINHPNTVYVFGTHEIDGVPAIAMELVGGGTLEDLVRERGPLPPADAVRMILQVIDGLSAAYAVGLLHRDVKPSNCFVGLDGIVKIGDFGLSRPEGVTEDMRVTSSGMMVGTPGYSAPEQLLGEALDVRSDIYAVGGTLYTMLTGVPPFSAQPPVQALAAVLTGDPPPPHTIREGVPKLLSGVIMRCMARKAENRYPDYEALRRALEEAMSLRLEPAPVRWRLFAGLMDVGYAYGATSVVFAAAASITSRDFQSGIQLGLFFAVLFLIRVLGEAMAGASPGKQQFALRVTASESGKPSHLQSIARDGLICTVGALLGVLLTSDFLPFPAFVGWILLCLSGPSLFLTMTHRNGYAAVHDLLCRTRVQWSGREVVPATEISIVNGGQASIQGSRGRRIGPFEIDGIAFTLADGSEVFAGMDPVLHRPVWCIERIGASRRVRRRVAVWRAEPDCAGLPVVGQAMNTGTHTKQSADNVCVTTLNRLLGGCVYRGCTIWPVTLPTSLQ